MEVSKQSPSVVCGRQSLTEMQTMDYMLMFFLNVNVKIDYTLSHKQEARNPLLPGNIVCKVHAHIPDSSSFRLCLKKESSV